MADVRFLILVGPPSLDPSRMGFPPSPRDPAQPPVIVGEPSRVRGRRAGVRRRSVAAQEGWYAWRLMASNNRRLARSVTSFAMRPGTVDAITHLTAQLDELRPCVLTDQRNGGWGWRAELDGVPIAVCPHWYERERDCRSGFHRFVEAALHAHVAEGGTVLRGGRAPMPSTVNLERSRRWPAN